MNNLTECFICGEKDFQTKMLVMGMYAHHDCVEMEYSKMFSHNRILNHKEILPGTKAKIEISDIINDIISKSYCGCRLKTTKAILKELHNDINRRALKAIKVLNSEQG